MVEGIEKVSFVCTSYRRFYCVRRIVSQFLAQTYPYKELIIFNTDMEHPYELGFEHPDIIVVNNDTDYITGEKYKNRGEICRDAVKHATGDYFMLADDDDIYLPYHIEQAVDGIRENGLDSWKPQKSLFAISDRVEFCQNTLEASVIVKMDRIREIGFREDKTGYEGLSWYTKLRDEGQLDEYNKKYVPSYCFNWSDPSEVAGHKQSGDINNPDNFENHKQSSGDYCSAPLIPLDKSELDTTYQKYIEFLKSKENEISEEHYKRYFSPLLN
jgi:hypothetical protein